MYVFTIRLQYKFYQLSKFFNSKFVTNEYVIYLLSFVYAMKNKNSKICPCTVIFYDFQTKFLLPNINIYQFSLALMKH